MLSAEVRTAGSGVDHLSDAPAQGAGARESLEYPCVICRRRTRWVDLLTLSGSQVVELTSFDAAEPGVHLGAGEQDRTVVGACAVAYGDAPIG